MKNFLWVIGLCLFLNSCTNDDNENPENSFYDGALTDLSDLDVQGTWALQSITFEDEVYIVPENIPECGKDFFKLLPSNQYYEYIFTSSSCQFESNNFQWNLNNGVITLSNGAEEAEWVILSLNSQGMRVRMKLDVNQDGLLDEVVVYIIRYEPQEMDFYTDTFHWLNTIGELDAIKLGWSPYEGFNDFDRVEIYRLGENCSSSESELISTITDPTIGLFIDENPPAWDEICYQMKLYTSEGLLGESDAVLVYTDAIEVPQVNITSLQVNEGQIELNWEEYSGYYFSHYNIEAQNYTSGSGGGYVEIPIVDIYNQSSITFTDTHPPYFSDPVYVLNVYNIFGTRNTYKILNENVWESNFTRPEILPIYNLKSIIHDPDENIVYFTDISTLYAFNYETNELINSVNLNTSSINDIKLFNYNGQKEIAILNGMDCDIFRADNLQYIGNLLSGSFTFYDEMEMLSEDLYAFTDRQDIYLFQRTSNSLYLVSSYEVYPSSASISQLNILPLNNGSLLVGNQDEYQGKVFIYSDQGILSNPIPVSANITGQWKNWGAYSSSQNYIVDGTSGKIYSAFTMEATNNLPVGFLATDLADNGNSILGTYNLYSPSGNDYFQKEVIAYSYPSLTPTIYNTEGYPIYVFEKNSGQKISISQGLKNGNSNTKFYFIEILE